MNSSILMIVKGIIVVFLSRKTKGHANDVEPLIRKVLRDARLPTSIMGIGGDGDISTGLRDTLEWIIDLKDDMEVTSEDLLTRIKINTGVDNHYLETIQLAIVNSDDPDEVDSRIRLNTSEIKTELSNQELSSIVSRASRTLHKEGSYVDKLEFIKGLMLNLEGIKSNLRQTGPASEDELGSDDPSSLAEFFGRAKDNISGKGVLKTGLVGLNRLLGFNGSPRGYYVNIAALTHNYKTGLLLDVFRHFLMYNIPFMWDKTKKPLIIRVSFENRIEQDIPKIYKDIYEVETGTKVDMSKVDPKDAAVYVHKKLTATGYNFRMLFFSPNDFSADDLIAVLDGYEKQGFEIHHLNLDYLELIAKNDTLTRNDLAITNAIERVRGYCFPKGINVFSAHQLSTEAQELSRQGASNLVKMVKEGGYYMNCKSLGTKVDTELVGHIVKTGDKSYLTLARGKCRGSNTDEPARWKICAYPFQSLGTIHEDVNKDKPDVIYDMYTLSSPENNEEEQSSTSMPESSDTGGDDIDF